MSKNILVCAAHPDDEVLGCGGTIARHVANGDKVSVIWMTDGVGSRGYSEAELSAHETLRNVAAVNATEILGFGKAFHGMFPDNAMDGYPLLDIVHWVESCVKDMEAAPQIIYTHHGGDLNVDHRITHQAVMTAFRPIPGSSVEAIYAFEVPSSTEWASSAEQAFRPDTFVDITDFMADKLKALDAYKMEMREFPHARSTSAILGLAMWRGANAGVQRAESFMTLRRIER